MKSLQTGLSAILWGLLIVAISSFANDPVTPENTYDSIIVTKITDITSAQYDGIEAAVGAIDELNIEYTCMWSGVMVLKLNNSQLHQTGDIHLYVKNVLHDAATLKKLEVLHVYTGLSGMAKC